MKQQIRPIVLVTTIGTLATACSAGLPNDDIVPTAGRGSTSAVAGGSKGIGGSGVQSSTGGTNTNGATTPTNGGTPATTSKGGTSSVGSSGGARAASGGSLSQGGGGASSAGSWVTAGTKSVAGSPASAGTASGTAGSAPTCANGGGTVALFHFDGVNGSTALVDSSGAQKVATITGNPQISTAQSKFGGGSLYLNGTAAAHTNYVTIDGGSDFSLPGDYTLDFWYFPVSYTDTWGGIAGITTWDDVNVGNHTIGAAWNARGANLHFGGNYYPASSTPAPTIANWHHIALTRIGKTFRAFVDGKTTYTNASSTETFCGLIILSCALNGDNGDFNGYIDELRLVKGAAVWTSDFAVPVAPHAACSSGTGRATGSAGAAGSSGASGVSGATSTTWGGSGGRGANGGTSATGGATTTAGAGAAVSASAGTGGMLGLGGATVVPTGCTAVTGTAYFCDDFESGLSKWAVSGLDWNTTNVARSGNYSATDSPNGNYAYDTDASLTLAASIDLSGSTMPVLSFWHRIALSGYNNNWDDGYVEASADGGTTWTQIGRFVPSDNTSTWSLKQLSLATYKTQRVRVRFRLWDNAMAVAESVADGWYIDDVTIQETN